MWFLKIFSFLTGGVVKNVTKTITDHLTRKVEAKVDIRQIEADIEINRDTLENMSGMELASQASDLALARLQSMRDILVKEQQNLLTSWIRPALALPVVIFWGKVIVWDTVLQLGTTPYPGEMVSWMVTLVPPVYFLSRVYEKTKG